jgi:hypothetical protein
MAGNAAEALDRVDISAEKLCRPRKPLIGKALVAGNAIFYLLLAKCGDCQEQNAHKSHPKKLT